MLWPLSVVLVQRTVGYPSTSWASCCGRYGYSFWPIWSFRVADVVVADMVQTQDAAVALHDVLHSCILGSACTCLLRK